MAAYNGNLFEVRECIKQDFDPYELNNQGDTALRVAVMAGHLEIVRYLVEDCLVSLAFKSATGSTPLHIAAICGHQHLVDCAALCGHVRAVKLLIEGYDLRPNVANKDGSLPIHLACHAGRVDVVHYLLKPYPEMINSTDNRGFGLLHCAAAGGRCQVVNYLTLKKGCDPTSGGTVGIPPLHCAIAGKVNDHWQDKISSTESKTRLDLTDLITGANDPLHMEAIEFLVEKLNCSPNSSAGINTYIPLQLACMCDDVEVVDYFIYQCKCDKMNKGSDGKTLLHLAVSLTALNVLKYLIFEQKCDLLVSQDSDGNTPLHYLAVLDTYLTYDKEEEQDSELSRYFVSNVIVHNQKLNTDHLINYLITTLSGRTNPVNSDGRTPLHLACISNNLKVVKALIELGDCNKMARDKAKVTPLQYAVHCGHMFIVKYFLIEQNCDPMQIREQSAMLALISAKQGHLEILMFLNKKLNIDFNRIVNEQGERPIHLACSSGQADTVQYLKEKCGVNVHVKGLCGRNPLHYAVYYGHLGIVRYLATIQSIDLMSEDDQKYTAAHLAAWRGHLSVLKYLRDEHNCSLTVPNNRGLLPIHSACKEGHLTVVKYLIDKCGWDPQTEDANKLSPMHYATVVNLDDADRTIDKYKTISYLVNKGCDPMIKLDNGITPLHLAAAKGHLKTVQFYLFDLKCDPNVKSNTGLTPLHFACISGDYDTASCLLSHPDCNASIKDNNNRIPLHYAVIKDHLDIVQLLTLSPNCDPLAKDISRLSPVHYALKYNKTIITSVFVQFKDCTTGNTILHTAATDSGLLEIVKVFITVFKCDVNIKNTLGLTPLHLACKNGQTDVVKLLVSQSDCDQMCKDSDGLSPLHYAAKNGDEDIINLLPSPLKYDLPEYKDNKGMTPLHYAVMGGSLFALLLLIERNFNPDCVDFKAIHFYILQLRLEPALNS